MKTAVSPPMAIPKYLAVFWSWIDACSKSNSSAAEAMLKLSRSWPVAAILTEGLIGFADWAQLSMLCRSRLDPDFQST